MSVRHVIFDCDGVLVDSEDLSNSIMLELLAERGLRLGREQADEVFLGHTLPACMRIAEHLLGGSVGEDFLDELERRSRHAFETELQPVRGVRAVLEFLPVAASVASNSSREGLARKLRLTGLSEFFAGRLYSFEDVVRPKPHPDMYLLAAERAGLTAGQCVVVEDSVTGVGAARAAGMRVFGYAPLGGEQLAVAGAEPFECMSALGALLLAAVHG